MRNLTQYPITDDEIERALVWASSRAIAEQGFGGIFGAALSTAKQRLTLLPELIEVLEIYTQATESLAGVEDDDDEGEIYSQILSSQGSPAIAAWTRARNLLARLEEG